MIISRILGWLAAVTTAVVIGMWSFAIGNELRTPAKSLFIAAPFDGTASASLAYQSFAVRTGQNAGAKADGNEHALARHAYRSEPLSLAALGIIAMSMTDPKDAARRQSLLETAGRLSRRSVLISNELIKASAAKGDDRTFFKWLSRLMLTGNEARKVYGAAMADATAKPGAIAALTPILGAKPRWADYYWVLVAGRPNSWVNGAKLRSAIARAPYRQTDVSQTDQTLLARLVRAGEFDVAHQLARHLGLRRAGAAEMLYNGDFGSPPLLIPFDWQLSALGNLGSSLDNREKRMTISAIGGAHGAAARQLLRLAPGDYRLSWALSTSASRETGALVAQLSCADPRVNSPALPPVPLSAGKHEARWSIAGDPCPWYWFSIDVAVADGDVGIDASLDRLSLVAAAKDAELTQGNGR